jgi:hypothetical protein
MRTDYRRTIQLKANSFHNALDKILEGNYFDPGNEEIIKIEKDYDEHATTT